MATLYTDPRARFPIVLAGFTAFLDLYATQPLLPALAAAFAQPPVAVSLTITAPTVAVAIAAPMIGRLADSVGRKQVIVWSAVVLAAATILAATASSLRELVMWRFVQGLATPGVFAITMAYIHEEWPLSNVGRATAAYVSGTVIGGFSGRAVTGLIAQAWNWRAAFVVLGLLNVIAAVSVWRWLPRERAHEQPKRRPGALGRVFHNRPLMAAYAVGFCVLFTQVAMFTYVTFHLGGPPFFLSTAALGSLFVVYLAGAALTPFAGPVVDTRGHRSGLGLGLVVGAAGGLLTAVPSLPVIVLGLALSATGVFIAQTTTSSFVGAVTAEDRGLAVGLYAMFYYAGGSLGGVLPGLFWATGGWIACVLMVLAVQAITALIAWRYWRRSNI
jgi:predicted MFS family arabinose efflux permease